MSQERSRRRIQVTGIVQGVGFRPHVFALAQRLRLGGFVSNDSRGVTIEVEGDSGALDSFTSELRSSPPPQAWLETFASTAIPALGGGLLFEIRQSERITGESTPISPDLATCADCLAELFNPLDRRYRYPFLNCTNCGPRFTIVRDIPYDRPLTTMASFPMCAACEREYRDPSNRRFHAQPNACPDCGPRLWMEPSGAAGENAIQEALDLFDRGGILAIKGIGGFHLACDARSDRAVEQLRIRKGRVDKPFAVMVRDAEAAELHAVVNDAERRLLESRERPIVLLTARPETGLSRLVAPGHAHLGLLLPYSPLHHLLLERGVPLVMTSGNRSDEPIARDNGEARERLQSLATAFLLHDREIHVVCDDSVRRLEMTLRRSRGYTPSPVLLPAAGPQVLAVGGELKSTFCLTRGGRAYMSQHIGDMENVETLEAFERALEQMQALFRVKPEVIACDLHPGYLSTRWAQLFAKTHGLPLVSVQHHHAHGAALMAEAGCAPGEPLIAVVFDGTGYGTDGAIWGGEILLVEGAGFERLVHLKYTPIPGGDAAIRRPYRMALIHLRAAGIEWEPDLPCVRAAPAAERRILTIQGNSPLTSSMGRLFDAAASLLDVRQAVNYEAQGAMEFEALAAAAVGDGGRYEFRFEGEAIDPAPVWWGMVADLRSGVPTPVLAARFHHSVAAMIAEACRRASRHANGVRTVGLTGGVFQNSLLLSLTIPALEAAGFRVLRHQVAPPNDGGLSLGQAAVAIAHSERRRSS